MHIFVCIFSYSAFQPQECNKTQRQSLCRDNSGPVQRSVKAVHGTESQLRWKGLVETVGLEPGLKVLK